MLSTLLHDEIDNINYNNGMKAPGAARQKPPPAAAARKN